MPYERHSYTAFCLKKQLAVVGGERPGMRPLQLSKQENGFKQGPKKKKKTGQIWYTFRR